MSLLRGPRTRGSWATARKGPRKPASAKRDWDSTVHDLTVHRATPEELLRRHELHKSKNRTLVHLELQEKAPKRKWGKQKQMAHGSLEKRKLTLMREILSDQYQLQDVLERSDQVMAVVKDLFGDVPRRRTGFPNVTMAPNCGLDSSKGRIVQKHDPPTQLSVLSESVMDSQAVNEVEEETSSICQSDDEQHDSFDFKFSINSDRLLQLLREENSSGNSQLWSEKEEGKNTLSQEANIPSTPTTTSPLLEHSALNASSEVKRIHSRLLNKEGEETMNPMYTVKQVLNPDSRKQKQIAAKVKRKQATQNSSRQRMGDSHANSFPLDLPRDNKSSLDVLNCMIDKVEHELEEYERCTGREVQKTRKSEGLAGFTLSLVNALCRLMCYLKESEMQLHEKDLIRQQHEEMLNEHRELIDALTAEILLVREENITIQKKLQQYMISTNEQLTSLVQSFKGFALTESERGQSPNHFGIASKGPANSQEKSTLSYYEPRTDAGNRENILKFPHEDVPLKFPQKPSASGSVEAGGSLPTHIFQPAVLLSPPQQKSSQKSSPFQNVFKIISPSTENTEREPCRERTSPSSLVTQSTSEEKYLFSQRQPISPAEKDLESSQEKVSLPSLGDSGKNNAIREFSQCSDLLGQIAELTQQNSFIKTQLSKFRGFSEERGDGLHQPGPIQNINSSLDTSKEQTQLIIPKSLEERIAELNRQSAEARDKLLQLIDQQKLGAAYMVSPLVSPIPPPSLNYTENARKTIEVSTPGAFAMDSSKENTPSPASVTSIRRSAGSSGKPCSPLSATSESVKLSPGSQRPKVKQQKEEGWFALSMHIM
ncbi:spindle and centriole-associated protein 1 isoform X2 [Nothoprocta perdicaria]|uniref:spindle and centriole-associated protein 1 isoform X2 n=1 Tax=Nothoprocta perdicaria TaxID=30464 RepID=UPI000E1C1EFD|nr:spindle and centriole-associated protein 1 isoform X2 [Nothoprocta perdicaria]